MHALTGEHRTFSWHEDTLFGVTVHVAVARRFIPIRVHSVDLSEVLLLKCNNRVQEARLLWHLLPQDHTLLQLGVVGLVVEIRLVALAIFEARANVIFN